MKVELELDEEFWKVFCDFSKVTNRKPEKLAAEGLREFLEVRLDLAEFSTKAMADQLREKLKEIERREDDKV
ncbi:hypothetical protein DRP07_12660 [Archaeoglobales archaeon]|nr:MAG: hypothetical protein DRP07_12660 [Archaeoglobales archaeon]